MQPILCKKCGETRLPAKIEGGQPFCPACGEVYFELGDAFTDPGEFIKLILALESGEETMRRMMSESPLLRFLGR